MEYKYIAKQIRVCGIECWEVTLFGNSKILDTARFHTESMCATWAMKTVSKLKRG